MEPDDEDVLVPGLKKEEPVASVSEEPREVMSLADEMLYLDCLRAGMDFHIVRNHAQTCIKA
jgi:hypothetical protein